MAGERDERARFAEVLTNYRTLVYSLGIVLIGLLSLWAVTTIGWFDRHSATEAFVEQLAGLVITTGGLAILWDLRGKRDIIQEVFAKAGLSSDIESTGLQRASMDWRVIPWSGLIQRSRQIDVFIAYGSTWLSTHSTELAEFAKQRRNKMRYILPDPEDPVAMAVLAERFDYTPEIIEGKIQEAARTVAKISREGNADIRVWFRKGAPTYTCYRFDDTVAVTLYQHKVGRGAIPALVVGDGTFKEFFVADLAAIIKQSREVGIGVLLGDRNA